MYSAVVFVFFKPSYRSYADCPTQIRKKISIAGEPEPTSSPAASQGSLQRSLSKTCPNWNRTTKMQSKSTTWKKGIIPSDRIHPATILHGFPLVQVCRIEARHLRRFSPPCIAGSQPARVIWFVQCPMWSLDDLISASRKMNDTSGSKGNIGEDVQD
ncbi:uncharacterized protein LOC129755402 isoform X2 [Uranotaenia lowii]|nr:uncharacterized protein LOC129750716 isoform X2 [Uranotaenia lowii]XP_055607834.1 uncharacterized protein LOC129755402 isoform X2 [Uranotaenia lowii]